MGHMGHIGHKRKVWGYLAGVPHMATFKEIAMGTWPSGMESG
jgi:hypothetical protein